MPGGCSLLPCCPVPPWRPQHWVPPQHSSLATLCCPLLGRIPREHLSRADSNSPPHGCVNPREPLLSLSVGLLSPEVSRQGLTNPEKHHLPPPHYGGQGEPNSLGLVTAIENRAHGGPKAQQGTLRWTQRQSSRVSLSPSISRRYRLGPQRKAKGMSQIPLKNHTSRESRPA